MATRTISTRLAIEGESQYIGSMTRINGEIKSLQSALKLTESQFRNNANSMAALTAKGDALNNLYTAQAAKVKELRAALDNAKSSETAYAARKAELTAKIEANNKALDAQDAKVIAAAKSWANQASTVSKCETELAKLRDSTDDTSEAQADLEKKIAAAKAKMAELEKETGGAAKTAGELIVENKSLSTELQKNEGYLNAASRGVSSWQDKLNTAEIKLSDLDAELKLNDEYLDEARNSADGCATSIDRFGDRVKESTSNAQNLKDALMAAGVVAALKATADALEACVDASIDFESAMAGVSKTTDMADDELEEMGDAIQQLATKIPATASEIANVAEAAGQLGIAKEDLLDFSEVMVNLGTATNLSSTEAASSLAKFANVVSMSADNYENLGSTIVALGNNFATTEADIVSMATRLASTGDLVGLSEAEIMAVATALSSVGIEAEAGGSAVAKLLKQFEVMVQTGSSDLEGFAQVAGMSADEFASAWGDNAVQALSAFINGLGKINDAGGSSVAVLEELGITETRLSNAVLAMASSNNILGRTLSTANTAWEENTALAKEAATRYETTESKLQLLSNAADNVKIAVGDQLTPAIGNLAEVGADALNWCADFIDQNDAIVPLVTATASAIGVLAAGITGYTVVTKLAKAATEAFSLVLDTNPLFMTATAITAVVAGLAVLTATIDDSAVPSVKELTSAASEMSEAMDSAAATRDATVESTIAAANVAETYISKLEKLEAAGIKTEAQEREYHNTLELLCQVVPELSNYIDLQNDTIEGGTEALRENTEAWKQNAIQQAYQEELTQLYQEYADVQIEAAKNSIKLTEAETAAEEAERKHADALVRMNELWEEASERAAQMSEEYGYTVDTTACLTEEYYELQRSLETYVQEQCEAESAATAYQKAIDADREAMASANDEIALAEEAIKVLTEETDRNTEANGQNAESQEEMAAAAGEVQTQVSSLSQAYQEAYDAAHDSISKQIGLFDTFAATVSADTDTVEEMMQRWSEQTQNLASYTENLAKAAQYGVDEGLVLSLSDGSAESAGYLATIITEIERLGVTTEGMSADAAAFVEKFNASFSETQVAQDEFANTVAGMQTDFAKAVADMEQTADQADFSGLSESVEKEFATVEDDFQSIGADITGGLACGITNGVKRVASASSEAAQAAIDACRAVLDSHSDSRVMIGVGKDFVGGMVTGIKSRKEELSGIVTDLGSGINDSVTSAFRSTVTNSMSEFSTISSKAKAVMSDLKNTITSAASGLSLYGTGQNLVDGMVSGIVSKASSLYNTMNSVVSKAIATARTAASVRSPSKKTTEIFEYVGDGMVVGLENRRQKVKDTAQSVVTDALKLEIGDSVKSTAAYIDKAIPKLDMENIARSSTRSNTNIKHDYGGFNFQIYQQPGEDAESLAYRVMDVIQTEIMKKEVAICG